MGPFTFRPAVLFLPSRGVNIAWIQKQSIRMLQEIPSKPSAVPAQQKHINQRLYANIFTQVIKRQAIEYRRLLIRPDRDRLLACPRQKEGVSPLC